MSKQFDPAPEKDGAEEQTAEVAKETANQEGYTSIFDGPATNSYKGRVAKPKSKGSRYVSNVIIALVLCVALALGVFAANRFWPKSENGEAASSTLSIVSSEAKKILNENESKTTAETIDGMGGVERISVKNPAGEYTLKSFWGTEETIDPTTGSYMTVDALKWTLSKVKGQDISAVSFSSSTLGFLVTDLLGITYESVYAQDKNATIPQGGKTYSQECGLDAVKTQLTMHYKNGASKTLLLGNQTPTKDGYFVSFVTKAGKDDAIPVEDNKIYVVADEAVVFFLKDPIYYVEKNIVDAVEQADETYDEYGNMQEDPYFISGALSYFEELSLSGSGYPKPFEFEIVEETQPGYDSIYLMTSPYTQNVDLTAMENLLKPVADGLTAYNCLSMNATDAQLKQYGLDQPVCVARYVVKEKEYLVKIGKQTNAEENYYAVMVKDNPSIFEVGADDLPFMNYDEADFASNTLYSCNITEIASLRVQMKGFDHTFQLKHGTDASGEATLAVQTANGQSVVEDDFRTMYMDLLGLNSFENVTDGKDAATPYMTLTLTYHSFDQVDVIRLSPYTDRRYFMSLNGMGSTVILSNTVDQLEQSIRSLVS